MRVWMLAGLALVCAASLAAAQPIPEGAQPCPGSAYTAADCPGGTCWAGAPNGCGSRSLKIIAAEIVPDQWPLGVDFSAACNTHDTCYFTLGSTKEQCDQAFLDAMKAECDRAVRCVDVPIIGQQCGDNPVYQVCLTLAQGYFEAVSSLGQESFERDQADQAAHVQQCQAAADAPP